VVVHVEDEVLAHHGQADETDVSLWCSVFHYVFFMIWPTDARCTPEPTQRPCEKSAEMLRKKSNFIVLVKKQESQSHSQKKDYSKNLNIC
jgi:hypothetical protein